MGSGNTVEQQIRPGKTVHTQVWTLCTHCNLGMHTKLPSCDSELIFPFTIYSLKIKTPKIKTPQKDPERQLELEERKLQLKSHDVCRTV